MGLKVTGLTETSYALSNLHEKTNKAGLNELRQGGEDIAELAKKRAPVDKGNLEEAINSDTEDRTGKNGRVVLYVGVDEDKAVARGVVGDYALQMHEGVYELGEKSKAKKNSNGEPVGPKFLESAADELEDDISKAIERAIYGVLS